MLNTIKHTLLRLCLTLPAKILAGLIVFYLLFSYFAINPLAQRLVPWLADTQLASHASVGRVAFDPLRLQVTVEQFRLNERSGAPLASVEKLAIDLESSGLLQWAWKLKDIQLLAPHVTVRISEHGKLNWANLLAKLNEDDSPPSQALPRVVIDHFVLASGQIEYQDAQRPTPLNTSLSPLAFELDGFSTLPQDRGDYLIAAKLPQQGGTLKWKGNIGVNPVVSKGHLAIEHIQLAKLLALASPAGPPVQITDGELDSAFSYDFSLINDQPNMQLDTVRLALSKLTGHHELTGQFSLQQLAVQSPHILLQTDKNITIQLQDIRVDLADFTLQKTQTAAALQHLQITLPQLNITHTADIQVSFEHLNAELTDAQLTQAGKPLLTLPALTINEVSLDLSQHKAAVEKITLTHGRVTTQRDRQGNINWQQVFTGDASLPKAPQDMPTEKTADTPPFAWSIHALQLQHWQAAYQDHSFRQPLDVTVADINIEMALAAEKTSFAIRQLAADLNTITVNSAQKRVASLNKITLQQADIALHTQHISANSLQLSGLNTSLIKLANQPLNWQSIFAPADISQASATASHGKAEAKSAWSLSVKQLALNQANLHIEDQSNSKPVLLDIEQAALSIKDTSLDLRRALPVKAAFKVKQGGQFELHGKLTPAPWQADLQFSLTNLALTPFSPYINQHALLQLSEGTASLAGRLRANASSQLVFDGNFNIAQFSLLEEVSQAPFLRWDRLSSDSVSLSLLPNQLHITTLNLVKPQGKFIIYEDRSMNVTRLLRNQAVANEQTSLASVTKTASENPGPSTNSGNALIQNRQLPAKGTTAAATPAAAPTAPSNATDPFPVTIESMRIDQAMLTFADLSLTPQFGTDIHNLGGVINSLSTNPHTVAQVELDGKVDEYGSARIRGSMQPFQATQFTNLKLAFTNLEMNRLTPYSGKFAGRKIESGKLSVDLAYNIKQRQLAGENKFVIQKLKLGAQVDSKDAADLPLDLAIAILEDSDGIIDLDLPISGSLDDPQFSYGSIVWKAFKNILTKIVTAPFSALGKLFGGGDKLEALVFEPGRADLSPPEQEKLQAVSTALGKRQQLKLGIVPAYDASADTRALQEATLRRQVAEELGTKLSPEQTAGPIDLNNPKVQVAIRTLHDRLTNKGLLKRLAGKLEKPKAGYFEDAQEALTASIVISEAELQTLGRTRGESIQQALLATEVAADRVSLGQAVAVKSAGKTVPVRLTLDVIKP